MAFNPSKLQAQWTKEAANEWRMLSSATLKGDVSEASEWIFRQLLTIDRPRNLVGQNCYGGGIFEVPNRFQVPFYCGFLWRNGEGGFFCSVKLSRPLFFVDQVYQGNAPPMNNRVQYVLAI
jgi:hypothetical protein